MKPPSPPPPQSVKITDNKTDLTFQMFKEMIYNNPDPFKRELFKWDKTTHRDIFLEMLAQMKKLSLLSTALKSYDEKDKLSIVQPEFNNHQQLRCYFSDSYVVVEVNPRPKSSSSKWTHIVENHGADEPEDKPRYEELKIMQDLSEEVWQVVTKGVEMCVETVEQYLYALVHEQPPVYEQMKLIRIGGKTQEELKKEAEAEAWAKIHVLKKEKELNVAAKAEKRKQFWDKVFGIKGKISFS
jgi:hypothetical protein